MIFFAIFDPDPCAHLVKDPLSRATAIGDNAHTCTVATQGAYQLTFSLQSFHKETELYVTSYRLILDVKFIE